MTQEMTQENFDYTYSIFSYADREIGLVPPGEFVDLNGLSVKTQEDIIGYISTHADTVEEMIAEALAYAENFTDTVKYAMDNLKERIKGEQDENGEGAEDLEMELVHLELMTYWTFDPVDLEKDVRERWAEEHCEEEEEAQA